MVATWSDKCIIPLLLLATCIENGNFLFNQALPPRKGEKVKSIERVVGWIQCDQIWRNFATLAKF